jgi:hypothetical protein
LDKQHRITSETFRSQGDDPTLPDNYVDPQALADLRRLAGIDSLSLLKPYNLAVTEEKNISDIGTERAEYQRKHNIRPGTDEWFKLWFARPKLTGENPEPKK